MKPQPLKLFDSHAHLSFDQFSREEWGDLFARAHDSGVIAIMNVATDQPSLQKGLELKQASPPVALYLSAATTPHDVKGVEDPFFPIVRDMASKKLLTAIGETGFDFFRRPDCPKEQEAVFLRYVELAQQERLPLIVHCRDSFPTLLGILHEAGPSLRGVLHCFTGNKDEARALLDLGWYLSISGIVTFPKSEALREVVQFVPEGRLLVETDSPYLTPQPKRGMRNEPSFLPYIVQIIASVRNTTYEAIAESSFANAKELFQSHE